MRRNIGPCFLDP